MPHCFFGDDISPDLRGLRLDTTLYPILLIFVGDDISPDLRGLRQIHSQISLYG